MMARPAHIARLGRTQYDACWRLQHALVELRREGTLRDCLLLTEHDHVYTIGTTGSDLHMLASETELKEKGAVLVHTDRGGDITYHGPGQLVGYPILNLLESSADLHRYLRDLEEVVIRAIAGYGIRGERLAGYTGVWVHGEKLCAIGVRASRWITMHGFALNVNTDLSYFSRIIPCGIFERGVTSLSDLLGRAIPLEEVSRSIEQEFAGVFGLDFSPLDRTDLDERVRAAGLPDVNVISV